jgi:tetratricopeptide (TPR) repeat protein
VLYRQREFRAAEEIYLELAPQDPRFFEGSRVSLGRIALLTQRYDLADRYFDEAMARRSDQVNALLGKSVAAEGRGDRKMAIEITRGALKSHGSSPLPWLRMAELHAGLAAAEGYLHQASLRGYEVSDAQRAALLPR